MMRLLQTRERMMARLEQGDPRVVVASDGDDGSSSIRLMHLLLSSAAAGEAGDAHAAAAALHEVYRLASSRGGDPSQRVAAYFADALASTSRLLRSPAAAASTPRITEQFLAYTMFYQASPLYQLAHFTANQAIVEAFEAGGTRRLHVVDFDAAYGFQWPSLIQSLSDAAAATTSASTSSSCDGDESGVSLRITGLGSSADELRQTEARLTRFASGCPNVRFEFEGIVNRGDHDGTIKIKTDQHATVVVNLVFPSSTRNSRECSTLLARVRSLNPSLVFLVEKHEGSGLGINAATSRDQASSLLPRFAASLRYFAAVFDSLHECLPADSAERIAIERDHLGKEISSAIASSLDHQRGRGVTWKEVMEGAGFEAVKLSSRTVSQAKLLLKMKSGAGGFRVIEGDGGKAMSLWWRENTALITATAWRRRRSSSSWVIHQQFN